MIKAEIIADSINTKTGDRITSFILEYPRMVHAELMTHRVFSKNSASSRAIPIEKFIEQITVNPALPVWWGKNQSGMQAKEELDNTIKRVRSSSEPDSTDYEYAKIIWLEARDSAIEFAKRMNHLGVHKQIVNRLLEPWFHIRVILTGTEFENWFALRSHPDAQPEIQALSNMMLDQYNNSEPKRLQPDEWHIPFGDKIDQSKLNDLWNDGSGIVHMSHEEWTKAVQDAKIKIAVARAARTSYFNYEGKDDYRADIKLCDKLFGSSPKHLSPTEHVAQAYPESVFIGNFKGWKQYRKFFTDENLKDDRIIKKL